MNNDIEKCNNIDIYEIFDYFNDHPIMFVGIGLSIMIMAASNILDKKYNKGE